MMLVGVGSAMRASNPRNFLSLLPLPSRTVNLCWNWLHRIWLIELINLSWCKRRSIGTVESFFSFLWHVLERSNWINRTLKIEQRMVFFNSFSSMYGIPSYESLKIYDTISSYVLCSVFIWQTTSISDVIFMSRTLMEWTCMSHLRHGNSSPGHTKSQKVHRHAQHDNITSDLWSEWKSHASAFQAKHTNRLCCE